MSLYQIGFVILTWNSDKYIGSCIDAIGGLGDRFSSSVVVIDNGSDDNTVRNIEDAFCRQKDDLAYTELVGLDKNYGTTYSRNIGLRKFISGEIPADYVCVLDSDTEINSGAFLALCDELDRDPSCGIIGPRMHDAQNKYQVSGRDFATIIEKFLKVQPIKSLQQRGEQMQYIIPDEGKGCSPVGYLMSACWVMRRDTAARIGYLDEKIFYSPEDLEYCIRCWKAGHKVVYCYDADILHHWQRISRKKLISKHNYEHIKGLFYVLGKYHCLFGTEKLWASFGEIADGMPRGKM